MNPETPLASSRLARFEEPSRGACGTIICCAEAHSRSMPTRAFRPARLFTPLLNSICELLANILCERCSSSFCAIACCTIRKQTPVRPAHWQRQCPNETVKTRVRQAFVWLGVSGGGEASARPRLALGHLRADPPEMDHKARMATVRYNCTSFVGLTRAQTRTAGL